MTSPAEVSSSFGRAAARYRTHALVQRAAADWLAEWLPAPADRLGRAVELGAGPGPFTDKLLPWPGSLVATDLSPEMCAEGRRRLPKLEWRTAAAEAPPAGPWDWIFSSSMLQWIAEPTLALSAWRRELAPEGRILCGMFVAPTLPEWSALSPDVAPFEWRSIEHWTAALHRAGLRLVRSDAKTLVCEFPSAIAFLRSLHLVGAAPARRVPPEKLRAALRAYEARFPSAAGVRSTWTFFRFEAKR